MKNIRICEVCILFLIGILGVNLANVKVEAADIQNILDWDESYNEGGTKEFPFYVFSAGTLFVELDDTMACDDYSVFIKDNLGTYIYDEVFDWLADDDNSFSIDLESGNYTIVFSTDGEVDFSVHAYFEYNSPKEDSVFWLSEEYLDLYVGEKEKLTIESELENIGFDVIWSSNKPSVATVNSDGTVIAKKAGTAIIKAVVNDEAYECEVHVKKKLPTYKEVVKKAKKYQTKNIKFQQIDVGYQSRLCALGYWGSRLYKKRGYGLVIEDESYIEIKKKGSTATICLVISGKHRFIAASPMYADYTKLKLYTSNRKITYDFTSASEYATYSYKYHTYTTTLKWKSKISSNSKVSLEKLNKLIRIFEHKNVTLKTLTDDGSGMTWGVVPEVTRKRWLKLFRTYKELLALYK